jgi:hypothetical protein
MRRLLEVIVLEETSILDEKIGLGAWGSITMRALGYLLIAGVFAYILFRTGYTPNRVLAAAIMVSAAAVALYPAKSVRPEAVLASMIHYYLSGRRRPQPKAPRSTPVTSSDTEEPEKKKGELGKGKASRRKV